MAHDTPDWLRSATIYSVFPRNHGRGTLQAIAADVPRIRALGVDVLWLMPVQVIGTLRRKGVHGSPYAIADYRSLEPSLGTWDDWTQLVSEAHRHGMKLMLDVVFHHTSPDSVLAHDHRDWFLLDADGNPMPKEAYWSDVVDLRFLEADGRPNQPLWDELIATLEFWRTRGVDGFRCDVATLVPQAFWLEARRRLAQTGEVLWLAETSHPRFAARLAAAGWPVWTDAQQLEAFDLAYDYDGFEVLDDYWEDKAGLSDFLDCVRRQVAELPPGSKLRFAENHDQPRAAHKWGTGERLRTWTEFLSLLPGPFLVYAGQEFRATHSPDHFVVDPIALEGDEGHTEFLKQTLARAKQLKTSGGAFALELRADGRVELAWGEVRKVFDLSAPDRHGSA